MTTGTKIRLLREQKGWDQGFIAAKLDVTQPAISKLESDQTKLSWDNAVKLGELFGVDPEYFFDSAVNNYVYNNQKVNQLFNSEYTEVDIEHFKQSYESQIKLKDDLLSANNKIISTLEEHIRDLKQQIIELKQKK
ncbi:helix-turn-helix domain-containing protein [Mucilaginibacter gossypii]|uniref:Helix-turn-helix n=1 Tax=Mucilaginibacter gossypii TaxID=551996 RepID=A0A1G8A5B5_9SPHI|nr:helix-turn-helix transcriptional regulator [Mucilaginibacter gossypii]SDH16063.1 Helix-turn-helix [Mucilaginibacter gossypii]